MAKVSDIWALRDGMWIEKIHEYAKSLTDEKPSERDTSFDPIDDVALWDTDMIDFTQMTITKLLKAISDGNHY